MSWDGTINYCQSCDVVLDGNRARFCAQHDLDRKRFRKDKTQPHLYVVTPEAVEGLQALYDATIHLERHIGRATTHFRHTKDVPKWVDDLMAATKDVLHHVHVHLAPTFDLAEPGSNEY